MCEQTEINYLDGEVVWVKLGSCWWPGEVVGSEKLPPDLLPSFRKPPIAVVKFFQEDTYEYVKNINSIYKYNCSRKNEFIRKGLYLYRTKPGQMSKFPDDVIHAETAIGGDTDILTRDEVQETKKESYAGLFGDSAKKTSGSGKKGKSGRGRPSESPRAFTPARKMLKEKADYKVHILVQGTKTPSIDSAPTETVEATPSTSITEVEPVVETPKKEEKPNNDQKTTPSFSTPVASSSGIYACHACSFSTTRLNVLILHNKTHSVSFIPYTPSPVRKKPATKVSSKSTPNSSKTPKVRRPRKEITDKLSKKHLVKKRVAEEKSEGGEAKKSKTDEEIKSSLLADWDDGDEDSIEDSNIVAMVGSPEVPVAAGSPAVPTPAELPTTHISPDLTPILEKKSDSSPTCEKPESSSDSKYEFCEDEDWPEETDAGRKIPRMMNPKRKEETKSLSLDEDDVAREVAELLTKTTVPDLPAAPEPLKVEENFPEPTIVKSPDKSDENTFKHQQAEKPALEVPTTKAIFKTKTFFRSRHSRSQDAIGKYVAEQLNAVERMDISESDINGSEVASSPEARESSPIEHVKVARLAPKIQLKKMKAEAAQLREQEKLNEHFDNVQDLNQFGDDSSTPSIISDNADVEKDKENDFEAKLSKAPQDVLYPTQEIKPVYSEYLSPTKTLLNKDNNYHDEDAMQCNADLVLPIEKDSLVESKPPNVTSDIVHEEQADKSEGISNETLEEKSCSLPIVMQTDESESVDEEKNIANAIKYPETSLEKAFEPSVEPFMNESTASAVDALLSVSRDTDRVTRIISNDLPEDLFEDDNKDSPSVTSLNGFNDYAQTEQESCKEVEPERIKMFDEEIKLTADESVTTNQETNDAKLDSDRAEGDAADKLTTRADSIIPVDEGILEQFSDTATNVGNIPSESDLQIAETLINLPSTAIQNKTNEHNEKINLSILLDNEMLSEVPVHTEHSMIVKEQVKDILNDELISQKVEPKCDSLLISKKEAINTRFETEQEKSENLNAAQSLVQMSESIDHKLNIGESNAGNTKKVPGPGEFDIEQNIGAENINMLDQKLSELSSDNVNEIPNNMCPKFDSSTSKLLKILEEPCTPKSINKSASTKQLVVSGREKILNFDVAKSSFKSKPQSPKQKIIIRRTASNKNIVNNINEVSGSADKIILSRTNNPSQDGSAVQTFTIQTSPDTPSDANTIIIQQKIRKITKPPAKLQKLKPQTSLIATNETKVANEMPTDDAIYDINSMPIVLSEDLLTPESIEKMPIVMTDNIISQPTNPSKLVKTRHTIDSEKVTTTASANKPEVKTLLVNPGGDGGKVSTPNILSKSSKLRGAKTMLIIDKTTGKQKVVMTKAEPAVKEQKSVSATTLIQPVAQNSGKSEKFIILSTPSSPRPARTQKILIDPQTGKAHVLLAKGSESQLNTAENKPVSAKLVPSSSDVSSPGNTVMIITNAQGAQSRIVLTPEHEKILFPNKQQSNVSQIKTIAHRITTNSGVPQKNATTIAPMKTQIIAPGRPQTIVAAKTQVVGSTKTGTIASVKASAMVPAKTQVVGSTKLQPAVSTKTQLVASTKSLGSTKPPALAPAKPPTRIVPKHKRAIITSKGQLIVGGRIATTAQNIAPMPEMRMVPKRIVASEPKKLVQTIQKASSEPLIFLQQKSGAVMQLTAAQFEHLQRTGQIVQKTSPVPENKIVIQKPLINISPIDCPAPVQKQRVRKSVMESPSPLKKMKQEIAIASAPVPISPVPALSPLSNPAQTSLVPAVSNTVSITTATSNYPNLDNFEELLPSTAIIRQPELVIPQPEQVAPPPPAPLSDGQLLAVPGEHFGGPPGSFYLCVEDNGTLTPIDNGPLVLENNQLVPMTVEPLPVLGAQPERRDILEAALANSDVFHADPPRDEAPDFRDLNANVSVHCRVSETSSTLNQPIMTPVEMPSKVDSEPAVPANLEAGLAVIGVTPHCVPTSLELPITVTDPRIAPKTTDPLSSNNYGTSLLPSPNTEMRFATTEETSVPIGGPISMPILTDEESVGKSMPILTDDLGERTASSMESALGSPSSLDVRESEPEESPWSRRLLTPCSDTSEASAEIPLQPSLQLSVSDLSHHHS